MFTIKKRKIMEVRIVLHIRLVETRIIGALEYLENTGEMFKKNTG